MITASLILVAGIAAASPGAPWTVAVFPSGAEFTLERAADPVSRQRGYMFREFVGPREGMLFLFETTEHQGFWMKNCKVSLDIIWLDDGFRVLEIAAKQPPCPAEGPCPTIFPFRASRFVLEVAGGITEQEGLQVGDRIVMLAEPGRP